MQFNEADVEWCVCLFVRSFSFPRLHVLFLHLLWYLYSFSHLCLFLHFMNSLEPTEHPSSAAFARGS